MKNLIKETLADRFNLDSFTLFAKNFFNEIDISPREISALDTEGHIKKFTFLGEFSDAQKRNIDVLAVELTGDTRVERARGFQRNLIAKYLKDNIKDAGLVAFYSQDNPDWRLSFVKIDYKLTEKGVKVEVGTPPKRYSFLVGQTEPSHTAQKQLLPILEDHKNNPLISEIEEAFSVEKVTKEFYEKYRGLFENLSKDLKKNRSFQIIASKENIDIDNFAKKLLGQIVFLYFLQKKGWLGVPQDKKWGEGDKFFLRILFNKAKTEKKNFYDKYLEILFYDTLNNPRRDEVDPSYSRYFDSKIPFLNGGLFEPDYDWKNTIVYLEDDIFEDIIGTFDLYNFTVKEDEPLEKEVAVDPEMLGKVFENLLPENLRKGQGAYYTPREIVHYMCQESLINHLSTETKVDIEKIRKLITSKDNIISEIEERSAEKVLTLWENETELLDKALSDIKVCDPACGSGAFLIGMLNEIVGARHIINPKRGEYLLKKETIQNCIYGVDIDHGAVEIAKLRLWLSLVVDYELRDIEPLPNLDYKIMCGNSLLEELIVGDESIKLFDEKLLNIAKSDKSEVLLFGGEIVEGKIGRAKNEYLENLLREKQKELFELNSKNQLTPEKKRGLEQEIKAIDKELNPKSKKPKGEAYHSDLFGEKADRYFKRLQALHKEYFTEYDPAKKKEKKRQIEDIELEFIKSSIKEKVDEIDTQIRNLNMQNPDDRKRQTGLMKKKLEYLAIPGQIHGSKTRPYFLWKLNFFEVFQEKGGFDVVIANPPYDVIEGMSKDKPQENFVGAIRNGGNYHHAFGGKLNLYRLFIERGLQLTKSTGALTYIVPSTLLADRSAVGLRQLFEQTTTLEFFIEIPEKTKIFENVTQATTVFLLQKRKINKNFKIAVNLRSKILPPDKFLSMNWGDIKEISGEDLSVPLITDNSEYQIIKKIHLNKMPLKQIAKIAQGDINLTIHKKYIMNDKMPYFLVRGEHISRFKVDFDEIKKERRWVNFKLMRKDLSEKKISIIETDISQERIVCQNVANMGLKRRIIPALIPSNVIVGHSAEFILPLENSMWNIKIILGILASTLLNWRFKKTSTNNHVNIYELENLPFPQSLRDDEQKIFIKYMDSILDITKDINYSQSIKMQAKVQEYERQIDQMVYKLYGLTYEEIEIVEKS